MTPDKLIIIRYYKFHIIFLYIFSEQSGINNYQQPKSQRYRSNFCDPKDVAEIS